MLENGQILYIWLGRDLPPHYLQAVFGVGDPQHIDPRQVMFSHRLANNNILSKFAIEVF